MTIDLTAAEKGLLQALLDHVQALLVWQDTVNAYVADDEHVLWTLDAEEKRVFDRLCQKLQFDVPGKKKARQLDRYPYPVHYSHACEVCGASIHIETPADWIRRYCSQHCRNKARYQRQKARKERR